MNNRLKIDNISNPQKGVTDNSCKEFFNPEYRGSYIVRDFNERDKIPCELRVNGLSVTIIEDFYSKWQLQIRNNESLCDNDNWVKINKGTKIYDGSNLFIFSSVEQSNIYLTTDDAKEGQLIYITNIDKYYKISDSLALVDPFPEKLDEPEDITQLEDDDLLIPVYKNGLPPLWKSYSDFGRIHTINNIKADNNKNVNLGIDDILPKGMPLEETLDDNKKVLLYDDTGKSYWKSLSEVGKVNSVNGVLPDVSKNVTLKISNIEDDKGLALLTDLNNEINNRINDYNELQLSIGTETSNRITQINDVEQKIQTEKSERISEDDILNYKIDTTKTELNTNFYAKLSQESTLRQNQDAVLDNKITTEKTDRINADNLKLDKPTTNNTPGYVLLGDGSTAPKSDFGKVDKVMGVSPVANKNVDISGVAMNWTNAQQRMSSLVSKHNDATFNRILGMDANGNLNEVGLLAITNEMSKATDAQKDAWRNASRKSNETTGATVPSITAVNAITLGNNAGFNYPFSVLGVNLNLVQHVNLIKVKDEQGQLIPEESVSITNFTRDSTTRITIEYPTNTFTNGFIVVELVDSLYYSVRSEEIEISDVIKPLTPPVVNWSYIGSTNRIQTNDVIEGNKITLLHNSTDSNQLTNRCNYETNPFITRDMVTQGFEITFKTSFVFKNEYRRIDGYPPIGIYLKTTDNIDFISLNQDDVSIMRYDFAFYKINTIQTIIYAGGTIENSIQNYLQQSYITIKYKNGLMNLIIYYEDGTIKNFKRSLYVPPSSSIVSGGLKVAIDIGGNYTPFQNAALDRSIEIIDFKIK